MASFFEKLQRAFLGLAHWLHRKPGEEHLLENRRAVWAKLLLVGVLCGVSLTIFAYYSAKRIQEWVAIKPLLKIEAKNWHVLYGDVGKCDGPLAASNCPANSNNPVLWQSVFSKADKEHAEKVRALKRKAGLWIGTKLELPASLEERQFVIGYISGPYEIFLNGRRILRAQQTGDTSPQSITLLDNTNWIAIHILQITDSAYPDIFNKSFGGEGIYSQASLYALTSYESFSFQARPIAFTLAQGVLGFLFLFFWLSAKRKQEYFYLSVFLFTQMAIQVRLYDAVYMSWDPTWCYRTRLALFILEGVFALSLGLSFARVRAQIFQYLIPVGVAFSLVPFLLRFSSAQLLDLCQFVGSKWVVSAYMIGALSCFLQAMALALEHSGESDFLTVRAQRLFFFATGLAGLTVLYAINAQQIASTSQYVFWHRFGHLGLMLFLAWIVISEYREQEQFAQRVKLSKYLHHLKPGESRFVEGTLLRVDLKGSKMMEAEANAKKAGFGYGTITGVWLSAMCEVVYKNGGEVLAESGDEFSAYFDSLSFPKPSETLEAILVEMTQRQRSVGQALGLEEQRMQFRASLVTGKLWVCWKGRIPGYSGDVMAESARILDLEKHLGSSAQSVLVIEKAPA